MTAVQSTRLERIKAICGHLGIDGMIISDPDNRFYVTGYRASDHGMTESSGVALISANESLLLTSPNYVAWAAEEAPEFEILPWGRPWEKTVVDTIAARDWKQVGFEPASLTFGSWQALTELGKTFSLIPMAGEIDRLRWVKSAEEIKLIEQAIAITDNVFEAVESALDPGKTERQIALEIEDLFRQHGAEGPAFPTAVAAGPHGARPHHNSGDTAVGEGVPIVIDMGALVGGYCADLTRTTWIGDVSDEVKRVYALVAQSQEAALAAVRAGVPASEVDQASRSVFESAGYGDAIVHSVGHGLGIRVHDGPSVSVRSNDRLETGNVVTIEPGLYFPDAFGVRIEDVVVVEDEGCRVLSRARKATVGI